MNSKYILWSGRLSGWLTAGGTYSSNRSEAKIFTRDEAIDYCRAQYRTGLSEFGLLPVALSDLGEIMTGRIA